MTKISFDFADSFVATVRGREMTIDTTGWHADGLAAIFAYGLQRKANDSTTSVKRDDFESDSDWQDAALAVAEKTIAAHKSGELRRARVAAPKDPVRAIALGMAMDVLKANPKIKISAIAKDKLAAWCVDYLDRNPKVMETAKLRHAENVAAAAEADSVDVGSLMADDDAAE